MCAVTHVILNRAATSPRNGWPSDPEQVCLQPLQFSCWDDRDPQRHLYPNLNDRYYLVAVGLSLQAGDDPTGGATAYWDDSIPRPSWATDENFCVKIGTLNFCKV